MEDVPNKENLPIPRVVVIFSGKRKSGKDYVTELLQKKLTPVVSSILRLSWPLKHQYAQEHSLELERLLDASDYKERCWADMIRWGEEWRRQDPGCFIHAVARGPGSDKPVWIISDCRRRSDLTYIREHWASARVSLVRVEASEVTRAGRGWVFTPGVDDAESECDLDSTSFDFVISNDGDEALLKEQIANLSSGLTSAGDIGDLGSREPPGPSATAVQTS